MPTAAPSQSPIHHHAPPMPQLLQGPLLLDARPGDMFLLGDDGECIYSLLVTPQATENGTRRWCVVVASNTPARPVGLLSSAPIETPVTPADAVGNARFDLNPQLWAGR